MFDRYQEHLDHEAGAAYDDRAERYAGEFSRCPRCGAMSIDAGGHCEGRYSEEEAPMRADLIVENHGSIAIIRGMTDAGYAWVEANVSSEGFQPFGLGARLAEPRYVQDIINGAEHDGLTVEVK